MGIHETLHVECIHHAVQSRAFAGVKQDIVALTEIQHIGASSARKLFNEGLRTAEVIAKTSADVIYNALSKGAPSRDPLPLIRCRRDRQEHKPACVIA